MSNAKTALEPEFKVGDLVRVKAIKSVAPGYHFKVGSIARIIPGLKHPYLVALAVVKTNFAEDELEKI